MARRLFLLHGRWTNLPERGATSHHHVGANCDKANIASSKFFFDPSAMR